MMPPITAPAAPVPTYTSWTDSAGSLWVLTGGPVTVTLPTLAGTVEVTQQ